MQQVYEINKIYTLRQSLSIRHVASGEEGVAGPLYFAQQRFLKYSNIKSEWSWSCPSPPPIFLGPFKNWSKNKGNDQWRCSYKDYDNTLPPSPIFTILESWGFVCLFGVFFGLSRLFGRIWPLLSKTRLSILSMIILILFFKIKFTTRLVFVNN